MTHNGNNVGSVRVVFGFVWVDGRYGGGVTVFRYTEYYIVAYVAEEAEGRIKFQVAR